MKKNYLSLVLSNFIKNRFNDEDPWGSKKNGDLIDDFIKKIDEILNKFSGKNSNSGGDFNNDNKKNNKIASVLTILFSLVAAGYLFTGFFQVQPDERGVILLFGKWNRTVPSGLHYKLPSPFEKLIKKKVTVIKKIDFGGVGTRPRNQKSDSYASHVAIGSQNGGGGVDENNLMLTGDSNLANVTFSVLWKINENEIERYLFTAKNPEDIVIAVSESVIRDIIGQSTFSYIQTDGRSSIRTLAKDTLQKIMDDYKLGIEIVRVDLQKVEPPSSVIDSFRDVERAQADQQSEKNRAEAYDRNTRARARGLIAEILNKSDAEKIAHKTRAQASVARFNALLKAYEQNKPIIKKWIYLNYMTEIFANTKKLIMGKSIKSLPHISLDKVVESSGEVALAEPADAVAIESKRVTDGVSIESNAVNRRNILA